MDIKSKTLFMTNIKYNTNEVDGGWIYDQLRNWNNEIPYEMMLKVREHQNRFLIEKKVVSISKNKKTMKYIEEHKAKIDSESQEGRLVEYFICLNSKNTEGLTYYRENCILKFDRSHPDIYIFRFYFSLQLVLLDLLQIDDFLNFQLKNYFKEEHQLKRFISSIINNISFSQLFNDKQRIEHINSWVGKDIVLKKDALGSLERIEWLGTQKNLSELFIELKKKNWLKEIPKKKLLKAYFTKTDSIEQVLKPSTDPSNYMDRYEGVYTKDYTAQFAQILQNTINK